MDHQEQPIAGDPLSPETAAGAEVDIADALDLIAEEVRGDNTGEVSPTLLEAVTELRDVLGIDDRLMFALPTELRSRSWSQRLRTPIGVDASGDAVFLDLKGPESGGDGPNGLVVGATGSGKSEFLKTLLLSLAVTQSASELQMFLIDFKGGAAFSPLERLPHVAGLVTNVAVDHSRLVRIEEVLLGELTRRQEILRRAGNYASLRDYEHARQSGSSLPPLASLLVVFDEVNEALSAWPELADLLAAITRLGRSLGVHLLVASQRLDEGRLGGVADEFGYRVALRTFSASESLAAIMNPIASTLPAVPGLGFLRRGQDSLIQFKAAYSSAPWNSNEAGQLTFADALVARLEGIEPPAPKLWLPPLETATLDALLPQVTLDARLGTSQDHRRIRVPIGMVDRPREHLIAPYIVDLTEPRSNLAVVGQPRSGKSVLLATVLAGISLTTTPVESQIFVLDFGGLAFAPINRIPHVQRIATRVEPDAIERAISELREIKQRRITYFDEHAISSMATYRRMRGEGVADDGFGDIFLIVDDWSRLQQGFPKLGDLARQVISGGAAWGFHVVASASEWSDFELSIVHTLDHALELRLENGNMSRINRRLAAAVPPNQPGRGLTSDGQHFLVALPRIDGQPLADTASDGFAKLIDQVVRRWPDQIERTTPALPERLDLATARDRVPNSPRDDRLILGVRRSDGAAVWLDPDEDPHLVVFGGRGSGKTSVLRTYIQEILRTRTPRQSQIVAIDQTGDLARDVPPEYLLESLPGGARAAAGLRELANYLQSRVPGPQVPPEQLQSRNWWVGADVLILIDDANLLDSATEDPFGPLRPLLPFAREIGMHIVLTLDPDGRPTSARLLARELEAAGTPTLELPRSVVHARLAPNDDYGLTAPGEAVLIDRLEGPTAVQLAWTEPDTPRLRLVE